MEIVSAKSIRIRPLSGATPAEVPERLTRSFVTIRTGRLSHPLTQYGAASGYGKMLTPLDDNSRQILLQTRLEVCVEVNSMCRLAFVFQNTR